MNKRSALIALVLLAVAAIVGGAFWLSLRQGEEPTTTIVEGKLFKEVHGYAVTWVIETKDGEEYELQGSEIDEIAELGEGTELRTEGSIEQSTVTSPVSGDPADESRSVISVTDYEIAGETAGEQPETTTLTGTLLVFWGDPPDSRLPPKEILYLADDQGQETEIKITPDTVFVDGYNVYYYGGKRVKITGDSYSEFGLLAATFIEIAE